MVIGRGLVQLNGIHFDQGHCVSQVRIKELCVELKLVNQDAQNGARQGLYTLPSRTHSGVTVPALPTTNELLRTDQKRSLAITARPLDRACSIPVHLSHILQHALACLSAIGASYSIHVPQRLSFRYAPRTYLSVVSLGL